MSFFRFRQILQEEEPHLRASIKHKGILHKGKIGETHAQLAGRKGIGSIDNMPYDSLGYVNEKGHYLDRGKAANYARDNNLFWFSKDTPWAKSITQLDTGSLKSYQEKILKNVKSRN
jgi:hypothetical protein